jgi:uncharacterized protein (DUF58 family)
VTKVVGVFVRFRRFTQNNDIGLILFSDQIELYIPPKKGRSHVLRIIRELIEFEPKSLKTDMPKL